MGFLRAVGTSESGAKRISNDYYPTPPWCTQALFATYPNIPTPVFDPAAGRGHILREVPGPVVGFDLYAYPNSFLKITTGIDFLTVKDRMGCDSMITNPPYANDMAEKFLTHAIVDLQFPFTAIIQRLAFLEGQKRYERFFSVYPPSHVYVLTGRPYCGDDRIEKDGGYGGIIPFAWYIWDRRTPYQDTKLSWINSKAKWTQNESSSLLQLLEQRN